VGLWTVASCNSSTEYQRFFTYPGSPKHYASLQQDEDIPYNLPIQATTLLTLKMETVLSAKTW